MPSRPYAAARLTIDGGILTSLQLGGGAPELAVRVAHLAASCGAQVERFIAKVIIRAPGPEDLRERIMVELRELGVSATCHDTAEPGPPDVEIDAGDPRSITLRPRAWAVATVEELRAYLDPVGRTTRRGTLRLQCMEGGRERLVEATEAWLRRQGMRVRQVA